MSSSGVAGPIGCELLNAAVLRQARLGSSVGARLAFDVTVAVDLTRR